MEIELDGVIDFWKKVQESVILIIEGLSEEHLQLRYEAENRSVAGIAVHIASAYHWWLGRVINDGGGYTPLSQSVRSKDEVIAILRNAYKRMDTYMRGLDPEGYRQRFEIEENGVKSEVSFIWIMMHVLEHDIHHRSQIGTVLRHNGRTIDPQRFWNQP